MKLKDFVLGLMFFVATLPAQADTYKQIAKTKEITTLLNDKFSVVNARKKIIKYEVIWVYSKVDSLGLKRVAFGYNADCTTGDVTQKYEIWYDQKGGIINAKNSPTPEDVSDNSLMGELRDRLCKKLVQS